MTQAYRIDQLATQGPFSRSKLYEMIKAGRLPARKLDGVTFVLEADWRALLEGAPLSTDANAGPSETFASAVSGITSVQKQFEEATARIV